MSAAASGTAGLTRGLWDDLRSREPRMATVGAILMLLALPVASLGLVDPRLFNGVGVWIKPAKFLLSVGLYLATLAWFAGYLDDRARRSRTLAGIAWVAIATGLFEVAYITLQAARGEASHYNVGTPLTAAMYAAMGIGAMTLTACSPALAWLLWRRPRAGVPVVFRASVIAGLVITFVLGAGFGSYMAAQPGHWVGGTHSDGNGLPLFGWSRDGGDLRVAHFLGIHAMQVLPLLGLMLAETRRGGWLLAVGTCAYAALAVATFVQAVGGLPVLG